MLRRPKSPKVLKFFLWFDIAVVAGMVFLCNPVMLHKCGFMDGPMLGLGAQPYWYDQTMILIKARGVFVLDAMTTDESYEGYNDWVKGGQQLKTITGYGLTLPHKQTVYLKATDWDNLEQTFALTEYEGPYDYEYKLTTISRTNATYVWWWVSTDINDCKVGDIIVFGPFSLLIFAMICLINIIIRGSHAFDLPIRFIKWATINKMPDDKAGRRR